MSSHPRYYFEMVLLRWMHLRKLVPLAELLEQFGTAVGATGAIAACAVLSHRSPAKPVRTGARSCRRTSCEGCTVAPPQRPRSHRPRSTVAPTAKEPIAPAAKRAIAPNLKDALLAEIRAGKPFFYNTVVAQAQKIEVAGDRVTFVFSPTHRALREQFEQSRAGSRPRRERVVGRRVMVESAQGDGAPPAGAADGAPKLDRRRRQARFEGRRDEVDSDPGRARGLPGGNPRRRRVGAMNIARRDAAGEADAGASAAADGRPARRSHRRRRHGDRGRQRHEAGAVDPDRSRSRLEGRRRDAAGSDRGRRQRRASQGRRAARSVDVRHAWRPENSRAS